MPTDRHTATGTCEIGHRKNTHSRPPVQPIIVFLGCVSRAQVQPALAVARKSDGRQVAPIGRLTLGAVGQRRISSSTRPSTSLPDLTPRMCMMVGATSMLRTCEMVL